MANIFEKISNANSIGITGHVRPDGDCIGSCMSLYNYLCGIYKDKQIDVFLEFVPEVYQFIHNVDRVNTTYETDTVYDVFISLDCGDVLRLGAAKELFEAATYTINIDHHISNTKFADFNHVKADASSTCETLYPLLEKEHITSEIATSLYTGIIHDTGVFKHSNTSKQTLEIAGELIAYGIPFSKIIDESFYQKTYMQNQLLGRCLTESILLLDGKCIVSTITKKILDFYGASAKDIDGIIDQLRITKGVEVAILIHETNPLEYKVSMRANGDVNVSEIAVLYGGGGHVKAAGCTMTGTEYDVINNLVREIDARLGVK